MAFSFTNRPLFLNPLGWIDGTVQTVPNGVVVNVADQAVPGWDAGVLSVQPDGRYETRPSGTAGAYEVAQQEPGKLVYRPGQTYVIATVGA